jgi:pimeloyl-ACP methyl ester carboxylesterase
MMRLFYGVGRPALYSAIVQDVLAGAVAAVRLPGAMRNHDCVSVECSRAGIDVAAAGSELTVSPPAAPVLLVHGYGGTDTVWKPLAARLSRAGFTDVRLVRYDAFRHDVHDIASALAGLAAAAVAETGSLGVHLVGHSLGGLVARYAVQCAGLRRHALTCATVATPHRGARLARVGRGPCAADLRPGSATLTKLENAPVSTGVRWLTYYSTSDLVAPSSTSVLDDAAFAATNVEIPNVGHLSILSSPLLARSLVHQLFLSQYRLGEAVGQGLVGDESFVA